MPSCGRFRGGVCDSTVDHGRRPPCLPQGRRTRRPKVTERPPRRARVLLAAALAPSLTLAAGCGSTADGSSGSSAKGGGTLVVFAAASLTETFTSLGKTFVAAHPGVRGKFNFGGSSALAQQITQGAPADVFAVV